MHACMCALDHFKQRCACIVTLAIFVHKKITVTPHSFSTELVFDEERLCWDFPRCVEAASKKGRVIIILDGIERLRLNRFNDTNLRWLPTSFGSHTRLIVSTESESAGEKATKQVCECMCVFVCAHA